VLTGVLLFLLIVALLLAVPLTITFHLLWKQGLSGHVQIGWANGRVQTDIPIRPGRGSKDKNQQKRKNRKNETKDIAISGIKLLRNKPFRQRVIRHIGDIWVAVDKRNLKLFIRLGLDDPAETGILWSALGPLSGILATNRNSQITLLPDFLAPSFELHSSGSIRIVPLQHIYLTTKLLLSPPIWIGFVRARKS
jgi:hypothetical protein